MVLDLGLGLGLGLNRVRDRDRIRVRPSGERVILFDEHPSPQKMENH